MNDKLFPCPFCGGIKIEYNINQYCFYCTHCGTNGPTNVNKKIAKINWNTRKERLQNLDLSKARDISLIIDNANNSTDASFTIIERLGVGTAKEKELERYQPCGCVLCTCEDEIQCHGCGAKNCGTKECVFKGTGIKVYKNNNESAKEKAVEWPKEEADLNYEIELMHPTRAYNLARERCIKAYEESIK